MQDWHTDQETIDWLRGWPEESKHHSHFAWPTDACGYEQHCRFIRWHNQYGFNYDNLNDEVLIYANKLAQGEIPEFVLAELTAPTMEELEER